MLDSLASFFKHPGDWVLVPIAGLAGAQAEFAWDLIAGSLIGPEPVSWATMAVVLGAKRVIWDHPRARKSKAMEMQTRAMTLDTLLEEIDHAEPKGKAKAELQDICIDLRTAKSVEAIDELIAHARDLRNRVIESLPA
ncbi:hypothetical protein [Qipengyuania citrea]|uniref:hypothetical protein n=1 Tax=Qipengyuania citrea TaxID=225971 RepID=UPI0020A10ABE|nr:hypothetical protein [Qipengyuania citrea]MCP2016857.1 hypothetical protein [Qipengyuania citrea]